nr:hypothetical protein Hi04_10k_c3780_00006 [uncultured bacterium]
MRPRALLAAVIASLVGGFASLALAHDPYEITSTLSLYSNRAELHVELEFRAGMLLSGHTETIADSEAAAQFEVARPALTRTAGQFFRFSIGHADLKPASTAVTLGVENHIRFKLSYPPLTNAFSLNIPGLKSLSDQGPYGASLTVLDMENRKVLGQSVLFASSAPAEFKTVPLKSGNTAAPSASPSETEQPVRINQSDLSARTSVQPEPARGVTTPQSNRSLKASSTIFLASAAVALGAALAFVRNRLTRKERTA